MKIVRLQGGLGNQMFQYAVVRATETNKGKKVYLDTSLLDENSVSTATFTARNYELNIFSEIRAKILSEKHKEMLFSNKWLARLERKLLNIRPIAISQTENEFVKIPDIKDIVLTGYFQTEKYFKDIRNDLLNDFQFPKLDQENSDLKAKILSEESVSIHVRRGDYLKAVINDYHGVLSLDYYLKAIERLESEFGTNLAYYLFSDDIEYVEKSFGFLKNKIIIDQNIGNNCWKDMHLMGSCKHHVIANSSFSWWGAWLSERKGLTLAPSRWFNNVKANFNIQDYISENWLIIDI